LNAVIAANSNDTEIAKARIANTAERDVEIQKIWTVDAGRKLTRKV